MNHLGFNIKLVTRGFVTEKELEAKLRELLGNYADIYVEPLANPEEQVWLRCPSCYKRDVWASSWHPFTVTRLELQSAGGVVECEYCGGDCTEATYKEIFHILEKG